MNTIRRSRPGRTILLLVLVLTACRQADEPVSQLTFPAPTIAATIPTPTLAPTIAPVIQEATVSPEPTATQTVVASPTGTAPPTGTAHPTGTASPTSTAHPTGTQAPSSTQTPSPTHTVAPAAVILSFTADVNAVDPGDQITLSWSTTAASTVTLWHLLATGQFGTSWDVPLEGSFVYDVNGWERNRTTFMLFATDAFGEWVSASLSVEVRCAGEWFIPDPPDVCPYDPPLVSAAAEQRFERGIMIWIAAEDRIVVLYDDGYSPQYDIFMDEWDPGEAEMDVTLAPPTGLYQPVRGFGLVWREGYGDVRNRLGWALETETAFETVVQSSSYAKYNSTYLRALDGAIWLLKPERSGWEKLPDG